jgi:hypothetical protein
LRVRNRFESCERGVHEREVTMRGSDIGHDAGLVWTRLNEGGETTPAALAKALGLKPAQIERAIGWLAREDKLVLAVDKRGATRVSLKQE